MINGKVVAITGASSGIGDAIARVLATQGVVKEAMAKSMDQLAISPVAIANAVCFALQQPADVEVSDIVVRPSAQN